MTVVDSGVSGGRVHICCAAWENGWGSVPPAQVLGFGSAVGMGILQRIPSRHFGGRTSGMVRSGSAQPDKHGLYNGSAKLGTESIGIMSNSGKKVELFPYASLEYSASPRAHPTMAISRPGRMLCCGDHI